MKIVTGMIISFVWMIAVFLGLRPTATLMGNRLHPHRTANSQRNRENRFHPEPVASASGALIGSAATNWTNFVTLLWVSVGLLAFTPLICTAQVLRYGVDGFRRFVRSNQWRRDWRLATS